MSIVLMDFVLRNIAKAMGEHGIKWKSKTHLDNDYADDLSILDQYVCKMNEVETKSIRLGIRGDEKVMWVTKRSIKWTA